MHESRYPMLYVDQDENSWCKTFKPNKYFEDAIIVSYRSMLSELNCNHDGLKKMSEKNKTP